MFFRVRRQLNYWRFNSIVSSIYETPPLAIVDSPLRIVSMLCPRDLTMYLLAAKVLYQRLGHGRFVVLPDRPMADSMLKAIQHHLSGAVEFIPLQSIPTGTCQRGGCWERLLACVDLSESHYVIQMDADTLALGDLPELRDAVANNRAFALAEGEPLVSFKEAATAVRDSTEAHIVDAAQRALGRYPGGEAMRYVRASAAFAGFPKAGATRAMVEEFHGEMEALLGPRWREWGSEQVASNAVVANCNSPLMLPYPDYTSVGPGADFGRLRFGHFVGSDRFLGQRFAHAGARLIRELLHPPQKRAA